MNIQVVTPPAVEPLTLQEAKDHLRITHSAQDTMIAAHIVTARAMFEHETGRAVIAQTIRAQRDRFPCGRVIQLEKAPIASVTSIKYYDTDGVQQTFSATNYRVDKDSTPGRIVLNYDQSWPDADSIPNAIAIDYVVGWADAAAVPKEIKSALLFVVAHLYSTPEPVNIGNIVNKIPMTYEWLIGPWRVYT